jgi:hypothetical protein
VQNSGSIKASNFLACYLAITFLGKPVNMGLYMVFSMNHHEDWFNWSEREFQPVSSIVGGGGGGSLVQIA